MAQAARAQSKVQEGLQYIQEAEKCLKSGWFRKADHEGAAQAYGNAGNAFRNAKSFEQAKGAYLKAADEQHLCKSLFQSAKSLELAGQMANELKQTEEAVVLTKQAGMRFRDNGTPDTASFVFQRAAKQAEGMNDETAIELYAMAAEMLEIEDKTRQVADVLGKSIRLLVKRKQFDECIKHMQKQIQCYKSVGSYPPICRTVVGLIVVHLARQDPVAADEVFKSAIEVPGFSDSDEAIAIEELLDAVEKGDPDALSQAVSKPVFTYQDNELAKLARDLKVDGDLNLTSQTQRSPPSSMPPLTVSHKPPPTDEMRPTEITKCEQEEHNVDEQEEHNVDEQEAEQEENLEKEDVQQDVLPPDVPQNEYDEEFEEGLS
ncbi:gamma-soluble NSF attachment protein-like [Corticium candelabrum]|uniref:gamma-soluble NSF attachment protein-like n=1 Tax=Corticium candelabrum TaxID=121492 RepID=UPI002E25BBEF|nr:gamma-soluble NSF attachment protein-like [Corticium candelabrum]